MPSLGASRTGGMLRSMLGHRFLPGCRLLPLLVLLAEPCSDGDRPTTRSGSTPRTPSSRSTGTASACSASETMNPTTPATSTSTHSETWPHSPKRNLSEQHEPAGPPVGAHASLLSARWGRSRAYRSRPVGPCLTLGEETRLVKPPCPTGAGGYCSRMKHLQFGAKSLFVGDEAADLLIDYGAQIAQLKTGDRVDLRGFSSEGNQITTSFLLNGGTSLVAETTSLTFEEPDNSAAVAYMRQRIDALAMTEDFVAGFQLLGENAN